MGKKPKTETISQMENQNDIVQPQPQPQPTPKKKRKRPAPINIKIETINPSSDKSLPLIGYFPSGYDPEKRKNEPRVSVLKHVRRNNRLQVVVTPGRSSKVEFVGTNYSGEAAAPQICSYALGVLDKETGTLRIVQIESNKIFRLEPRFGDEVNAVDEATKVVEDEEKDENEEDIKAKYSFSTKKSERTARREKALRAYRDPAAQEDLNSKMAEAAVNTDALQMGIEATSIARNIPPHDMSATIPQLAYPLEKIIFKGEWRYLLDIAEFLQQGRDIKSGPYPLFVCNRIHKLEEVQDVEAKESLACIFSYINHLIKFKDKNSMDGFRSAKDHKFPSILTQKFNDMFGNGEARRLADDKRDLIVSYILVLTLFVDNFKTDLTDIAKDLKMPRGDVVRHFQFLGCKFVQESGIKLATLPAPLKFEEPRLRRKK